MWYDKGYERYLGSDGFSTSRKCDALCHNAYLFRLFGVFVFPLLFYFFCGFSIVCGEVLGDVI